MKLIEDDISLLVQNHFPKFYEEQGNTFVEFVREYSTGLNKPTIIYFLLETY